MNATTITELTRENGWAPLRAHLGARAFGINAYTKNAGERIVGEHTEKGSGHEELYLVVAGRARSPSTGRSVTHRWAPRCSSHRGRSAPPRRSRTGRRSLVVGGRPGGVFRPRAWETNAKVFPMFGEGRIEDARELLRSVVGEYEDGEAIEYNLACCEARLGDVEQAFEHLGHSFEGRPDLVELARGDDDLAALHGDPRFDELVGGVVPTPLG